MHTYRASYLYLAGAMFISGSAVVVSKIMVASLPTFLATELGIVVGLFFLIPLLFFIKTFMLLFPFSIFDGLQYDWTKIDNSAIFCVFYYGAFVSFLSYVFWFKGIEKVPAGNAAVFTSVVPISSILLSALILKEQILILHIIGLVCIIIGIIISCLSVRSNHIH